MTKRLVLTACVALALGAAPFALAHDDESKDTQRCDTWSRPTHTPDEETPDSHHHTSGSDVVPPGEPAGTRGHGHSGHYYVRNDYGYVEVVGGQAYRGPDPDGNDFPGQGGYVQGEVDPGSGAPDGDFNLAFFGPDFDHLPAADPAAIQAWVNGTYGKLCLNAGGQQQEAETRDP